MSHSNPLNNRDPEGGDGENSRDHGASIRTNDDGARRHSLSVSFAEDVAQSVRRAHSHLHVSFLVPSQGGHGASGSPLIPHGVVTPQMQPSTGDPSFEDRTRELTDPSSAAVLIHPKPIDDLRRFRLLFVGLLLFIVSSTQGLHSLFGTILMQMVYMYDVRQMTIIYLCGSSFGMFVFPFGFLYDWFGPRIPIVAATVLTALGHLLFALMFAGHIEHSVRNSAIFYAILSWGCYGLDVVVLPTVLTHMPRNRGQPTGLLKTFSGLGASLLSCMFRGFFNNHYENLMWFMFSFTIVFGSLGAWYLEDAPYIIDRWEQRRLTPKKVLRKYLIRNRYMSQLMPRLRYVLIIIIMVLLNFYLTIQAVVVGFKRAEMTAGEYRGIAIGAVIITLLTLVLVIPVRAIDGVSLQDKEVIDKAREKERELAARRARQQQQQGREGKAQPEAAPAAPSGADAGGAGAIEETSLSPIDIETVEQNRRLGLGHEPAEYRERAGAAPAAPHETSVRVSEATSPTQSQTRRGLSFGASWHRAEPVSPSRPLLELHLDDDGEEDDKKSRSKREASTSMHAHGGSAGNVRPGDEAPQGNVAEAADHAHMASAASSTAQTPFLTASFAYAPHRPSGIGAPGKRIAVSTREPSTYNKPYFEAITVSGEVFYTPVYQTTFLESLTYIDLWLIFYTTFVVWGVGLTMTANWNIQIMSQARWMQLDYAYYVLFAAMSGVTTAGGRVFVGAYEHVLSLARERCGVEVVPTLAYPLASIGLFIGMILWIALPGDKVLVLAYIIGPAFYGVSTSFTPYVLGTIFDRDMGMHYGFIFLGAALGQVFFFYLSWFLTYDDQAVFIPFVGKRCIGQRKCMNRAVGIYIAVVFSSILTSWVVHQRYAKLVEGKLKHRRVVKRAVRKVLGRPLSDEDEGDNAARDGRPERGGHRAADQGRETGLASPHSSIEADAATAVPRHSSSGALMQDSPRNAA